MKKALFLGILAIAAISFWSCTKEEPVKDGAQIAKEALEKVKEAQIADTLDILTIDSIWGNESFPIDIAEPNFKQFVAVICAQHPQFKANYQLLRYLADEKGYDAAKEKFVVEDINENEYIKIGTAPEEKDEKEKAESKENSSCSVSYYRWKYTNDKDLIGVLYEIDGTYLVHFYDFTITKKALESNFTHAQNINHHIDLAGRAGFKDVVFPKDGGLRVKYMKEKDNVKSYFFDHWDGAEFKYTSVETPENDI